LSWLTLVALLLGFPLFSHAAEAPGALTIIVRDPTARLLPDARITITERESNAERTVETGDQGRVVVDQLDPGLYSVNVSKSGFVAAYEPSVRVVTRKNIQIEFELLGEQSIAEVVVRARQADRFASASSTYLDREALRSAVGGGADP